MKALSIIKQEHRNLGAVLFSLEKLLEEIEQGKNPELRAFHGLLTYIDRFLDECHHPKEDQYLFPALRQRCPEIGGVLDTREREHADGEKLLMEVMKALSAYELVGSPELPAFSAVLRRYTTFEREHAMEEEKQLFTLAEQRLSAADWGQIDAAFAANEDPLFGERRRSELEDLHTLVTSLVPAPYGFGSQWQ